MEKRNDDILCEYCGRRGRRDFVQVSGTGDGNRDQYRCANVPACERRQAVAEKRYSWT